NVLSRGIVGAGTSFALKYRYDDAGRLTFVDEQTGASSTRRLKELGYGRVNVGDDKRAGKLVQAKRYNWLDLDPPTGDEAATVTDRYVYAAAGGRISERQTRFHHDATSYAWSTGFDYDDLGNVSLLEYPRCRRRSGRA
ncbi:MAG: hypothetical protein ACRDKW_08335, partial [Actinomycetota bacterium]